MLGWPCEGRYRITRSSCHGSSATGRPSSVVWLSTHVCWVFKQQTSQSKRVKYEYYGGLTLLSSLIAT